MSETRKAIIASVRRVDGHVCTALRCPNQVKADTRYSSSRC